MKKLVINISLITTLFIITGCTSTNNDLSYVENAYFDCIEEIYNNGCLPPNNIKEILDNEKLINTNSNLKEYIYEGELNSVYPTVIYRYTDKLGILKAEYIKNTGSINRVSYEENSKTIKNKLTFLLNDIENEETLKDSSDITLKMEYDFTSLEEQLKVSNLILTETNKKSNFYKAYLKLCKYVDKDINITINNLEKIFPEIEVLKDNDYPYTLKSEEEGLYIDNNVLHYSTGKIILQYSSNGLNKIIIEPDTLKEQKELYEIIKRNIVNK